MPIVTIVGPLDLVAEQLGHELVATHPYEPMNRIHRRPLTQLPKRPRPGQGVQVVGVDEGSVTVHEDPGAARSHEATSCCGKR